MLDLRQEIHFWMKQNVLRLFFFAPRWLWIFEVYELIWKPLVWKRFPRTFGLIRKSFHKKLLSCSSSHLTSSSALWNIQKSARNTSSSHSAPFLMTRSVNAAWRRSFLQPLWSLWCIKWWWLRLCFVKLKNLTLWQWCLKSCSDMRKKTVQSYLAWNRKISHCLFSLCAVFALNMCSLRFTGLQWATERSQITVFFIALPLIY